MSPEQTIEHKVAMAVTGLSSDVLALSLMINDPAVAAVMAHDYETIEAARVQLGRLLGRLPVPQIKAA